MTADGARAGLSLLPEMSGPELGPARAGRPARGPQALDLSTIPLWSQLGDGRPLAAGERERYARLLDRPVDGVRVHEGAAPPGTGVAAWSAGGHVVLGPQLSPGQRQGALDHEVVHAAGQLAAPRAGAVPSSSAIESATEAAVTAMTWGARATVPLDPGSVPRGLPPGKDGEPLVITASSFEDAARQFQAILDEVQAGGTTRYTIVGRTAVMVFDRDGNSRGVFRLRIPAKIASGVHVPVGGRGQLYPLLRAGGRYRRGPAATGGDIDFGHDITKQEEYDDLVRGHFMMYVVPAANLAGPPPPEPSSTEQSDPLMQFKATAQANLPPWPGYVKAFTPQLTATNSTGSFLMHVENNQGRNDLDRMTNLMHRITFNWQVLKLDAQFMPVDGAIRSATRWDATKGKFERRARNAEADRQALLGEHPEGQGLPEKVVREAVADQVHDARLILSVTGEVVSQVVDSLVGGPENPFSEDIMDVQFREPGDYFVRCLATPVPGSDGSQQASTVGGVTVSVFDITQYAKEALGTAAGEAEKARQRIAAIDAALAAPPGTGQSPGDQARQARERAFLGFERSYSQAVIDARGDQGAVLAAQRDYLQARIAWLSGPALPPGDENFPAAVADELNHLRAAERQAGSTIDLAQSQLPDDATPTGLMTAVLIDEANGSRLDMTFSLGERRYVATDRLEVIIADVTGGQAGRVFNGMGDGSHGAGRPDAVRAAMRDLRQNLKRGRGELAYRLPARYAGIDLDLPNPMQLQLSVLDMVTETADDAAHALTLAALLAAPFTEGASLGILAVLAPVQAATSLYRIVDRAVYHDLSLDTALVMDFINIATVGLGGVGEASQLASRGVQLAAGTAGVAVKLLSWGNYVVIGWDTFRALTTPDPKDADPREGRKRRLQALLSAFEAVAIPVAEELKSEARPPPDHPAPESAGTGTAGEEGAPASGRPGGRADATAGADERPEPPATAGTENAAARPAARSDLPDLRRGLPGDLASAMRITRDTSPDFGRRSVLVEYTAEGGIITDISLRVGPEATFREIAEHVATIRSMQRYQGLSGRVRALLDRITAWLTRNPGSGPGTRAWEARLELEKLPPLIEARAREMAYPATTRARRAELELELADLERQLARHAADVDSAAAGQGFVAAEGISAGKAEAQRRGYPKLPDPNAEASDGTKLGEYIWRYTAGDSEPEVVRRGDGPKLIYDKKSGKFVPDTGARAEPSFGTTATRAEAYEALGGRDPESEFGRFTHMLVAEGVVRGPEAIIATMQDPGGLQYRTVRSNLKDVYARAVVDTITDPARLHATPLFKFLRGRGVAPEDALDQASHAEMLRVTRNLNSSDRGAVAERWYEAAFGAATAKQVTITPEQASAAGTSISTTRRLDRVSGSDIEELKNVSGRLDAGDQAQIEDQLRLIDRDIPLGQGKVQHVTYLKVSMLDPEGVLANAGYMYGRLDPIEPRASELMFEIWSSRGTSLLVTTQNRAILNDPAKLKAYLAYGTVQ